MRDTITKGDVIEVLKQMPDEFVDCVITSPPYYGLRDYGTARWQGGKKNCPHRYEKSMPGPNSDVGQRSNRQYHHAYKDICGLCGAIRIDQQLGLEKTLEEYLDKMLAVTKELKRVLKKTGTMFWNHGDSYNAKPPGNSAESQAKKIYEGDGAYGRLMNRNRGKNFRFDQYKMRGASGPEKSLTLQAHRLAIRMIDEQKWILRNTIIWHKPNVMPSSVKDRFTVDYEPVFFFTKQKHYCFEPQYEPQTYDIGERKGGNLGRKSLAGREGENIEYNPLGRNKRCVWKIPTSPYKEAHFATFPEKLIEPMVKAGCPEFICNKCGKAKEKMVEVNYKVRAIRSAREKHHKTDNLARENMPFMGDKVVKEIGYTDCGCNAGWNKGIVLDPFMGSGTVAVVARKLGRDYVGVELNEEYIKLAEKRLAQDILL